MASEDLNTAQVVDGDVVAQSTIGSSPYAEGTSLADSIDQSKLEAVSAIAEAMKAHADTENGASDAKAQDSQSDSRAAAKASKSKTSKVLECDRKLIKQVGTQESTGHTICCPSFSCAYGDVVIDGTVHDHDYYTCSCCSWTDWGGGGSSNRCVGADEELLREAYDQIRSGKPTVIHVAGPSGEHWICLIGYQNVEDPDHLDLANFIALDPWDGAQITATDRYTLYGDGCEHISER